MVIALLSAAAQVRAPVPTGPPYENGIMTVSVRRGRADIPRVATSICDVSRTEAPAR